MVNKFDLMDLYVLYFLLGAIVIYLGYKENNSLLLIFSGIGLKLYAILNMFWILKDKRKNGK